MGNAYSEANLILTPNAYKTGKMYCAKPTDGSADIGYTRASSAMRINSSRYLESIGNNIPRLHYPIGTGCPNWLFEPQRTNLVLHSSNYSNAVWLKSLVLIHSTTVKAPDNITNVQRMAEVAVNGVHQIAQIYTPSTINTYTFSAFIKSNGGTRNIGIVPINNNSIGHGKGIIVDQAGNFVALTPDGIGTVTYMIEQYSDGWFRVQVTGTPTSVGIVAPFIKFYDGTTDVYTGNTSEDILIWGTQLEVGNIATTPIETTASTVTQSADVASVSYDLPANATIYSEVLLQYGSLSNNIAYTLWEARVASDKRISVYRYNNQIWVDVINTTTQYNGSVHTIASPTYNQLVKVAVRITATQFFVFVNGSLVFTSDTLSMPDLTSGNTVFIGNENSLNQWAGRYNCFIIYDKVLSNTECNNLTAI